MIHVFLFMGAGGNQGAQGGNPILGFLPLVLIIFVMYFLLIRPQAKKQKAHKAMLEKVKKGDRVLTTGGILGTISGVKEKEGILIVKIAENVKIEITRTAIAQVLTQQAES